jgi:hypothetical protein
LSEADVVFRHQDLGRFEFGDGRWSGRLYLHLPPGHDSGKAACNDGDAKHNNTCGFHTLTFQHTMRDACFRRWSGRTPFPQGRFDHAKVKAWLTGRI